MTNIMFFRHFNQANTMIDVKSIKSKYEIRYIFRKVEIKMNVMKNRKY